MQTTSGSKYRLEESGSRDSDSGSESVDIESEFFDECDGTEDREGNSREIRRKSTVMPTLEVLWRSFEKENLMDSSAGDFKAGVENGGEDSPAISLVEESNLSDILANVSGEGEDGKGSAGEGSSGRRK